MTDIETGKLIEILLVEDSPGDARLTKEALKESKLYNKLVIVGDGEEAMQFLRKKGKYSEATKPDMILLDLNLPKKSGRDVLAEVKNDPELRRIPIVILTTSKAEEDILRSYDLHANCYITKPVGLKQLVEVVNTLENFWFSIVKLPPH